MFLNTPKISIQEKVEKAAPDQKKKVKAQIEKVKSQKSNSLGSHKGWYEVFEYKTEKP